MTSSGSFANKVRTWREEVIGTPAAQQSPSRLIAEMTLLAEAASIFDGVTAPASASMMTASCCWQSSSDGWPAKTSFRPLVIRPPSPSNTCLSWSSDRPASPNSGRRLRAQAQKFGQLLLHQRAHFLGAARAAQGVPAPTQRNSYLLELVERHALLRDSCGHQRGELAQPLRLWRAGRRAMSRRSHRRGLRRLRLDGLAADGLRPPLRHLRVGVDALLRERIHGRQPALRSPSARRCAWAGWRR